MKQKPQLLFVYNANSGLANAMIDAAHKILNPSTYSCSLCQLTYGPVREKSNWKQFREDAALQMQFLHKDEFAAEWGMKGYTDHEFPAIFLRSADELKLEVGATELNTMDSEEELMHRVSTIMEVNRDV